MKIVVTCRCGAPGDCNQNMLCCSKCKQWYHEKCLKCLSMPMFLGDRFFILVCALCNAGSECLARIEMHWHEIVHLVLYHLTTHQKKKYVELNKTLMPYIYDNWERLQLIGPIASSTPEIIRNKVIHTLETKRTKFKSGKEVKKKKTMWSLRDRAPPESPDVTISTARIKKDAIVWDFIVKGRQYKILKVKRAEEKESNKEGKAKSSTVNHTRQKNHNVSKCQGSVPNHTENGKIHRQKTKQTIKVTFNEESACFGLLDTLIPVPPEFTHYSSFRNSPKRKSNCDSSRMKFNKKHCNKESVSSPPLESNNVINNVKMNCKKNNTENSFAKDYLNLEDVDKDDFCIVGKRITSTGKVQYLFEWNRKNTEKESSTEQHHFKMTLRTGNCTY